MSSCLFLFLCQVLRDYYRFGKEVPKVINPTEISTESNILVEVLEACYKHHRRGQLGYLPSRHGKLCNYRDGMWILSETLKCSSFYCVYSVVADSLSYFRLQFMVCGDQNNVSSAINDLLVVLKVSCVSVWCMYLLCVIKLTRNIQLIRLIMVKKKYCCQFYTSFASLSLR